MEAYLANAQAQAEHAHGAAALRRLNTVVCPMKITFKLYASLTDYLPPSTGASNQMSWTWRPTPPSPDHRALRCR
jgi:hypothetical protein